MKKLVADLLPSVGPSPDNAISGGWQCPHEARDGTGNDPLHMSDDGGMMDWT